MDADSEMKQWEWEYDRRTEKQKTKRVIFHINTLSFHTAVSTWAADRELGEMEGRVVVKANKQIGHF